jgi:tetratricopeptide (TPR) repeat protein
MLDQAKEQYLKTLELDPSFRAAINGLGWTHYHLGEIDEAIEKFKLSQKLVGDPMMANAALGFIYARIGQLEELQKSLEQLKKREQSETNVSFSFDYAIINLGLKDYDKVFEYLNKSFDAKLGGLIFIRGKHWREIHDDERYKDLIRRMKLPCD